MAHALQIDTLKLAEDLEAAKGDPRGTARVIGQVIGTIDISKLATKADLKAEIAEVKGELKTEIAQSTNKTIYTLGGIIGVLFVLDRLVPLLGVSG